MFEKEINEIVAPFLDRYELISGGSCEYYLKDGFYIELKAKFPITNKETILSWNSAKIVIEYPYVHVIKGYGNDIRYALNLIRFNK